MKNVSQDEIKRVQSIVANQYALECNEALKHTIYAKPKLSNKYKGLLKEQVRLESKEFIPREDKSTKQVNIIYDINGLFVQLLTKAIIITYSVGVGKLGEIIHVLDAYTKDRNKMVYTANGIIDKAKENELKKINLNNL